MLSRFWILVPVIMAVGLVATGLSVRDGLIRLKSYERVVSVRGLAEREVVADIAFWPIQYTVTNNDLTVAQADLDSQGQKIEAFLKQKGIKADEYRVQRVDVVDLLAQQYRPENVQSGRYILTKTYMVATQNVKLVDEMARSVGELIAQGVILAQGMQPQYAFTQLNSVKPAMIAEATQSARGAAEQFAKDSGSEVGDIKTATQGLFQILPQYDDNQPESAVINKKVRVVTSVDYYLQ